MHLRTRLVCSEIFISPLKKFSIYFYKIFKDLCNENRGKLPRKILRQQEKRKILKLEHLVSPSFPKLFTFHAKGNNLRDLL